MRGTSGTRHRARTHGPRRDVEFLRLPFVSTSALRRALVRGAIAAALTTSSVASSAACPDNDASWPAEYVSAKPRAQACSKSDLAMFEARYDDQQGLKAIEAAMNAKNPACSACLFSDPADAVWNPIVHVGTNGYDARNNPAPCYELAPGGSMECGRAAHDLFNCVYTRCEYSLGRCTTPEAEIECTREVANDKTSCGQYAGEIERACGKERWASLREVCEPLFGQLRIVCGGAKENKDGGPSDDADAGGTFDEPEASADASPPATRIVETTSGCAQNGASPGGAGGGELAFVGACLVMVARCGLRRSSSRPARARRDRA